jgi:hypothetical protein
VKLTSQALITSTAVLITRDECNNFVSKTCCTRAEIEGANIRSHACIVRHVLCSCHWIICATTPLRLAMAGANLEDAQSYGVCASVVQTCFNAAPNTFPTLLTFVISYLFSKSSVKTFATTTPNNVLTNSGANIGCCIFSHTHTQCHGTVSEHFRLRA